jgi:hypothetical protein
MGRLYDSDIVVVKDESVGLDVGLDNGSQGGTRMLTARLLIVCVSRAQTYVQRWNYSVKLSCKDSCELFAAQRPTSDCQVSEKPDGMFTFLPVSARQGSSESAAHLGHSNA